MLEYILIFIVVAAAVWVVGKKLYREMSGSGCEQCGYSDGPCRTQNTIQLLPDDKPDAE